MLILGIDPGTASMGWGVIKATPERPILKDFGVAKTHPTFPMYKRLGFLYSHMDDIAKQFRPDLIVVESLFFNTNTKTAITVGQARGVVMLVAAHNNIDVTEYTALQAKKIISGYGRASKKEMQEAVKNCLGMSSIIKSDDANDGIAMALTYFMLSYKK